MPEQLFVGVDIGTSKFCTTVALSDGAGTVRYLGHGSTPAAGIRSGTVSDIDALSSALRQALDEAEYLAGMKVHDIVISVAGAELRGVDLKASLQIESGYPIYQPDVERVIALANADLSRSTTTIHRVIRGFAVDGQGTRNPLNKVGTTLEVWAKDFVASRELIDGIQEAASKLNVRVHALVPGGVASGEGVLRNDERERGVILMDIGGMTTDVALFVDGMLVDLAGFNLGGHHISRDLAMILEMPIEKAERLKMLHGVASLHGSSNLGVEWSPRGVAAIQNQAKTGTLSRNVPRAIAGARVEQIMTEVRNFIAQTDSRLIFHAGIVITGGTSRLPGLTEVTSELLGKPTRIADVVPRFGFPAVADAGASASIGLVRYCALRSTQTRAPLPSSREQALEAPGLVSYGTQTKRPGISANPFHRQRERRRSWQVGTYMREWMRELIPARH